MYSWKSDKWWIALTSPQWLCCTISNIFKVMTLWYVYCSPEWCYTIHLKCFHVQLYGNSSLFLLSYTLFQIKRVQKWNLKWLTMIIDFLVTCVAIQWIFSFVTTLLEKVISESQWIIQITIEVRHEWVVYFRSISKRFWMQYIQHVLV